MNKKFILLPPLLAASLLPGSCNQKQSGQPTTSDSLTATTADPTHQLKIGVIPLNSLYKSYKYYTQTNKQIEARLERNQQALASKAQKAQWTYTSYIERARKGPFTTQAQVDTEEKRVAAMQQKGAQLEQRYAEEAMKTQAGAQKTLHDEVVVQLKTLNADKKYDLTLTSTGLEGVMYTGEGLDITRGVPDFLDAAHKTKASDTKKPRK